MYYSDENLNLFASDLQNFLACKRITFLDHEVAKGNLKKPDYNSPSAAILQKLGNEHEENYIKHLESQGRQVIRLEKRDDSKRAHDETVNAMKAGYDIIAQPRMNLGKWGGYADILIKRNGTSKLGGYYYEVQDTKLSQTTKAATILQLSLYTEMVNAIQGPFAKVIGVIKPGDPFEKEELKIAEFEAYYRFIKKQFEDIMEEGIEEAYPLPVEKCSICPWWKSCRGKWLADDHLSLVAGLQRSHTKILNEHGIETVEGYAKEPKSIPEKPSTGSLETYDKLHGQAKVQVEGRSKKDYYELRQEWFRKTEENTEDKGLNKLPPPNDGDIYFDFEGDHFYPGGGLEYLFGYTLFNPSSKAHEYHKKWALDRTEEKTAFEDFMKFLASHEKSYPDFHIYHFAPYEPAAIARLASRHALNEVEVDDLLRKKKFVDLHRVIKESMQVAVERYSLKDLEAFAGFTRTLDLQTASEARRKLGAALNLDMLDRITEEDKNAVEEYNKDDCLATLKLHQWLEDIFQKEKDLYGFSRPELVEGEVSEKIRDREQRALDLYDALLNELPEDKESDDYKAKWLLLNSISYYRREERMGWFEFYRLRKLQPDELIEEKGAVAYLIYLETLPKKPRERNPVHRYSFPQQEVASDFTKIGTSVVDTDSLFAGTIKGYDGQKRWIDISTKDENFKRTLTIQADVSSLMNQNISLEKSLHSYVEYVTSNGFTGNHQCVHHLLLRQAPALENEDSFLQRKAGEDLKDYTYSTLKKMDQSVLPIQGPPGSGKTYLGALMIMRLVNDGKKIGVCALSHRAIQNVIEKVKEHAKDEKLKIEAIHYNSRTMDAPDDYEIVSNKQKAVQEVMNGKLTGGTVYFWASDSLDQQLDYLFIDEAGQLSLNQIISAAKAAKNLVLLGDPQQLEQPQQGAHPENSDISGLQHLLGDEDTIASDKGIFLDTTWRLPESICQFTSTLYYDGKLQSHSDTSNQNLTGSKQFPNPGLYYVPVSHDGKQNQSEEEIEVVEKIIDQLLKEKCNWTDREGKRHLLTKKDFRVVAPYNVQVDALKDRLPDVQVGTVDKFQGQEAPIVIYSMTSSSCEEAPRGMGFLLDPHRMNVATSRAQCLSILVANEKLFEPECHSIDQMRMANGMCMYREIANQVDDYLNN